MGPKKLLLSSALLITVAGAARADRPLPGPSQRPAARRATYFVDPQAGDDKAAGSADKPWRTLAGAAAKLAPGDTLYLHGGVYYEAVTLSLTGTADKPITIRSAPGELAVIDGGLREFAVSPRTAWEPVTGGAPGELRSTAAYPALSSVTGNFVATMIPLHPYKFHEDMRSDNPYWNVENATPGAGIYVGPGVWLDPASHRIHVRLAHTQVKALGADNYRGETDARKVPLVISAGKTPVTIAKAHHLRLQDLVIRGSNLHTLDVLASDHIELDGLTVYGGAPAVFMHGVDHLKFVRSVVRGLAAPWSSRASMKYRGNSPYLFVVSSKLPQSHDLEIAYNELTDNHDGIVIDSIKTLRFHHNRIDNFNDDALYLTLSPRQALPEDEQIYQNVITRTYTALSFAEDGAPNPVGPGVYLFRNVFDLREGTYVWPPKDAAADQGSTWSQSRICGDHGSPVWEPLLFYNNTVINADDAFRDYYGEQLIMGTKGTKRRLFDNMFVQVKGDPGLNFQGVTGDLEADGNLLWGMETGPHAPGGFFDTFRSSATFTESAKGHTAGWTAHDVYGDPKFVDVARSDLRPAPGSAAIDAGVAVPTSWPDPLRSLDKGKPDIGALPLGAPMLRVGPAAAPPPAP